MMEFFNQILTFINEDIYQFVVDMWAWLIIKITIMRIEWSIFMMTFSWDIAREIMIDLNISKEITNALSALDSETVKYLNFFNIINGINLILNAFITRFVMRFMGIS